ncbi:MAG TPA: protoporphyrinogen oxidase [Clostridia bacterium]|nr:protoporphyrinogen oxidase [Clostridia bacterium]
MRVAIIGGGISGLSAAFYLEKERAAGAPVEYVLFESTDRLGGSMYSERIEGCIVEAGPDSFLTEKPWASQLAAEVGIGHCLIGSNDADRKTYILIHGGLVVMPDGLQFMVPTKILPTGLSPLFSWGTKLRMIKELFHPPRPMQKDETVAEMVERHFGAEMVDRLADPLLSGVYGGDAASLSARAVLPRFVEMEEKYGSLSRAMLAARKRMLATANQNAKPRPLFTSMRDGMQQLVDAIVAHLTPMSLRLSSPVRDVEFRDGRWKVVLDGDTESFDAVILATPARVAGRLLERVKPELSADLGNIPYSSSVTVTMGYKTSQLRSLPPGFGFLVPRSEGKRMLACTFVHRKFPHRAPPDKGILRCFLGGAKDELVLGLGDKEIENIVRRELREVLGLDAEPTFIRIYRWRSAMAQYSSGHLDRVARIERNTQQLHGLALAGNAFKGIGVPDCVHSGQDAAKTMARLAVQTQPTK